MSQPRPNIIGIGTIVVDHLIVLPSHPEPDTKTAALKDHLQVGGPVPTALAMLRRLGHRCAFAGSWSDDAFGQLIEEDLQREEIDFTSSVRRTEGRTGFAHAWVCQETAKRTIAYQRATQPILAEELDRDRIAAAGALHLDGWPSEPALAAARLAQENGCLVTLDAGSPKGAMEALIAHVDVMNAPRRFLREFFGVDDVAGGVQRLLSMGPRVVTVTDGVEGAVIGTADAYHELPAFQIDPVDTTGAGDVFSGALVHAALQNWPPLRMLAFAMAAAALKCTRLGNRDALPTEEEIAVLIRSTDHTAGLGSERQLR